MKGIVAMTIGLVALLIAGMGFGVPPVLDILEEQGAIDLPEENAMVYTIERFGERVREAIELNREAWRENRLQERIREYGELHEKFQDAEFKEDMQRNMDYIWSEIEAQTNMTKEEIIALAEETLDEAVDRLREVESVEDCEGVYGEEAKAGCVGQWKTFPFRDLLICYWACERNAVNG